MSTTNKISRTKIAKILGSVSLPIFVLLEHFYAETYLPLVMITIAGAVVCYLMYTSDEEKEKQAYSNRLKIFTTVSTALAIAFFIYFKYMSN